MLDTKTAFQVMGLNKGANTNEIEKRFSVILKRHKVETQEGSSNIDIDRVTQAYNLLMGYSEETPTPSGKPNPILKKMGIDEKKASNFLYYYKFHIIISIIVLICAYFTVKSFVNKVEPDINLAFVGAFYYSDSEKFQDEVKKSIPGVKEVSVDQALIFPDDKTEQGPMMLMKATVIFAAQDIDLYILDKNTFNTYGKQGAFKNLDSLAGRLGIDKAANKDCMLKAADDQSEHLYGVDVSNCKIFKNCGIQGKEKIVALGPKGKFQDKAIKLLEFLQKQ